MGVDKLLLPFHRVGSEAQSQVIYHLAASSFPDGAISWLLFYF